MKDSIPFSDEWLRRAKRAHDDMRAHRLEEHEREIVKRQIRNARILAQHATRAGDHAKAAEYYAAIRKCYRLLGWAR